ncbi:MAG: RdgB/HAM1 family non-canonical purine NTP pyrophosphatase, partial [Chlamydiia bacterium]
MFPLLLATTNLHKARELRALLREPRIKALLGEVELDLLTPKDIPGYVVPDETGATFLENAILKAVNAAKAAQMPALADDSGLCIPALNGAPGVHSARYAGPDATDRESRRALLATMTGLHGEQRYGYYECALCLALPDGTYRTGTGTCQGEILSSDRGQGGFGYDALFLRHEYAKTFAEMDEALKNRISHRRKALERMVPHLRRLVEES